MIKQQKINGRVRPFQIEHRLSIVVRGPCLLLLFVIWLKTIVQNSISYEWFRQMGSARVVERTHHLHARRMKELIILCACTHEPYKI